MLYFHFKWPIANCKLYIFRLYFVIQIFPKIKKSFFNPTYNKTYNTYNKRILATLASISDSIFRTVLFEHTYEFFQTS